MAPVLRRYSLYTKTSSHSRREIKCCGCGKEGVHFIDCPTCLKLERDYKAGYITFEQYREQFHVLHRQAQREAAEVEKMSSKTFREFAELSLKNYRQRTEREVKLLG